MERMAGVVCLVGAFSLAGTSVVAGRFVVTTLGIFTITVVSLAFALLGLLPLCCRTLSRSTRHMTKKMWGYIFVQALFGIFFFRLFLLQGLLRTSTGEAGILTGATPAATVLLAWLFLREPMDRMRLLGIISTVTGIVILQGIFSPDIVFSQEHLIGNLLVLGAAMCESVFNILSRINSVNAAMSSEQALDPIVQTTLVVAIALLLSLGPALTEEPLAALIALSMAGWAALVWYGLFVTALAFVFWYAGIKRCDVSVAAAFSGMMPFTALVLSVVLLQEQPGWQQWIGGLLVVLGMVLTGLKAGPEQQESYG